MEKNQLLRKSLLDELNRSTELTSIISKICDVIAAEDTEVHNALQEWKREADSLEKFANKAELKIREDQIDRIRKAVKKILGESTNRLILATMMKPGKN